MPGRSGARLSRAAIALLLCATGGDAQGVITTVAGTDITYPGSSFSANSISFGQLSGVAVSPLTGKVYLASLSRSIVFQLDPIKNSVTIFAGIGIGAFSGDGGPAVNAALNGPRQLAFDSAGNLYIAESGRIRKVDTQGDITTAAAGLGGNATVAIGSDGSIYAGDGSRIVRVDLNGVKTVFAGTTRAGYSGDGGPATNALLNFPRTMVFDGSGNLLFIDQGNNVVRRVGTDGIISTVAGNGQIGTPVPGPAVASPLYQFLFNSLAVDKSGNIFIGSGATLLMVDPKGTLSVLIDHSISDFVFNAPVPLRSANLQSGPLAFDAAGNLYIAETFINILYRWSPQLGTVQLVGGYAPGFGIGDNGPALSAGLNNPQGVGLKPDGSLLIADTSNHRLRLVSPSGTISTVAGTGSPGYPKSGVATAVPVTNPRQAVSDGAGNIVIATPYGLERLDPAGNLSFLNLNLNPFSVAVDTQRNAYSPDAFANVVYRVSPDGKASIIAGTGRQGFSGDGGPATAASLNGPRGVAVDANGNVYIADYGNNRVRKVDANGIISTVAGGGATYQDRVPATQSLVQASMIAVDGQGSLYITDAFRVRKITPDNIIQTIAGIAPGFGGDGGPSTSAPLNSPQGLAVDISGNVYIADSSNNRIRKILATPPAFSVSNTQVTISGFSGGVPAQAGVAVTSPVQGLGYAINFATDTGGDWLGFDSLQGTAPGVLTITADPGALQPGTYRGTVTLSNPLAAPSTITIAVTFNVSAAEPASLSLQTQSLMFAFNGASSQASQQLTVSNQGGGTISFTASAATSTGGAWLSVSPQSGIASPAAPATLTITAVAGSLDPGTYSGLVTVASADTGQQLAIPVTMAISAAPRRIILSQTGLTFTAVAQAGQPLPQSLGILNGGGGSMNWTAQATTLSVAGWLNLSATSGTVTQPFLDVSFIDVSVNTQGLAPGNYYGQIQVSAAGATNSPQSVLVVLNVLPAGSSPAPQIRPTGLVFTGVAGAVNPGAQNVMAANLAASPVTFGSSSTYVGGGNFIVYLPTNATIAPDAPVKIVVQPDFTGLTPGIRRAALTLAFDDGSVRTVSILSVVAPASLAGAPAKAQERTASGCLPTRLIPAFTQLGPGASVPAGWPVDVLAQVVDDCGSPMTTGSVVANFGNGDPPLSLLSLQNGRWSATWQPRNSALSDVTVSLRAQQPDSNLTGTAQSTISLQGVQTLPVLSGSPVSAVALAQGPLAPGELVLIRGSGLANGPARSTSAPLAATLAGASVAIGGRQAPLLYADTTQVVAMVPPDLPVNEAQQLLIQRDSNLSLPNAVIAAAAQPAVFTLDGSGSGQGLIYQANGGGAGVLADASNPVKPGDTVIIYCIGLGALDAQGMTANPAAVFIGGQPAQVTYAGAAIPATLPPDGAPPILGGLVSSSLGGLYQIAAVVPEGVTPGTAAVSVTVAGQNSQPNVTLATAGP